MAINTIQSGKILLRIHNRKTDTTIAQFDTSSMKDFVKYLLFKFNPL